MPLQDGVSRQFRLFPDGAPSGEDPEATFDLDQPQIRGVTRVRCRSGELLELICRKKTGAGRWELLTDAGFSLAEVTGHGALSQGWRLSITGSAGTFELVNPESFGQQVIRTMLDGQTEGLVLTQKGEAVGSLVKRYRSSGGGLLSGLKRFVQGRDWVLDMRQVSEVPESMAGPRGRVILAAFALVALVNLDLSAPD